MTTITVTASDTAQAMDKIVERLGHDALILETVKRNGRIEMIASDDIEKTEAVEKSIPTDASTMKNLSGVNIEIGNGAGFTDIFDQQMINTIRERGQRSSSLESESFDHQVTNLENAKVLSELRDIKQMLNGMVITQPDGLDAKLGRTAPVRLYQAGFSSNAIRELQEFMVGLDDDGAITAFINALAERVVHRNAEVIFDSRVVFVIGSSGTGKTTLATKLAAYLKEHGISERMTLAAAVGPGISACEEVNAYARLLNIRSENFAISDISTAVQETSNRLIVDVNASHHDAVAAIQDVMQRIGSDKVSILQAIPGGSSATMINNQCKLYRQLQPIIALTKLDECEAMPGELSALAIEGSGVGLLTGTRSIVGGIAIATMPILAQYLHENTSTSQQTTDY